MRQDTLKRQMGGKSHKNENNTLRDVYTKHNGQAVYLTNSHDNSIMMRPADYTNPHYQHAPLHGPT
ncbi:hypothetical protein BCR44DRAFT_1427180 [Catenaria anguillulae PL171]|uniref:Uncharacterized protein n=1 Tax=Catenaria anguillulae PL171 TaxID=765915 RepID=A0A1Y2HWV7_9FUNG|nr:hypothetical protein BCR44DRAFT_1427180 [Catenaria anguillulae PL171]